MKNSTAPAAGEKVAPKESESLAVVVVRIHDLLAPLPEPDRKKVLQSVLALFGSTPLNEVVPAPSAGRGPGSGEQLELNGRRLGPNASRWISQNGLNREMLEEVFHFEQSGVRVIAADVPGDSKREQTINSYLLAGAAALLAADVGDFSDKDALTLCHSFGCYDKNNHTVNRGKIGNRMSGTRDSGFTLPAPGLKAAAAIVRQIAQVSAT